MSTLLGVRVLTMNKTGSDYHDVDPHILETARKLQILTWEIDEHGETLLTYLLHGRKYQIKTDVLIGDDLASRIWIVNNHAH